MTVVVDTLNLRLPIWAWACVLVGVLLTLGLCVWLVCRCCCRDAIRKSNMAVGGRRDHKKLLQRQGTSEGGFCWPEVDVSAASTKRLASQRVPSQRERDKGSGSSWAACNSPTLSQKYRPRGGSGFSDGFNMVEVQPLKKKDSSTLVPTPSTKRETTNPLAKMKASSPAKGSARDMPAQGAPWVTNPPQRNASGGPVAWRTSLETDLARESHAVQNKFVSNQL